MRSKYKLFWSKHTRKSTSQTVSASWHTLLLSVMSSQNVEAQNMVNLGSSPSDAFNKVNSVDQSHAKFDLRGDEGENRSQKVQNLVRIAVFRRFFAPQRRKYTPIELKFSRAFKSRPIPWTHSRTSIYRGQVYGLPAVLQKRNASINKRYGKTHEKV